MDEQGNLSNYFNVFSGPLNRGGYLLAGLFHLIEKDFPPDLPGTQAMEKWIWHLTVDKTQALIFGQVH